MRVRRTGRSMALSLLVAAGLCVGPPADAQGLGPAPAPAPQPEPPQPPPLPRRAPPVFFVDANGQPEGPLTLKDMQERIADGRLGRTTLVWRQGAPEWQRAAEVIELKPLFETAPPPLAPAQRFEQFMVGTWEAESLMGGFTVRTIVRYAGDGTFTGAQRMTQPNMNLPPVDMPLAGTWKTRALGEDRFILTLDIQGEFYPQSLTLSVIDDNHLRNETVGNVATRVE